MMILILRSRSFRYQQIMLKKNAFILITTSETFGKIFPEPSSFIISRLRDLSEFYYIYQKSCEFIPFTNPYSLHYIVHAYNW